MSRTDETLVEAVGRMSVQALAMSLGISVETLVERASEDHSYGSKTARVLEAVTHEPKRWRDIKRDDRRDP